MARKVAWGIDIGQTALRAVKAMAAGDRIEVLAFDSVEYEEVLSAPDVDKDNVIQQALRTFLSRNRIGPSDVVLGCISGQSALIRFIKLPPVEKKRIPDIVRYEAHQQIPFPLEEVVWDYKPLEKAYGPAEQVEVGIFAMRRDIVHAFLSNLVVCNLDADVLQLAPMALYNYVAFDQPGGQEAQIVIDMGAENTELLICTGASVWPRSLPVSGNDLTEAIMARFKVPFGKAETLKHMAKQSKYSTQIYQTLEPVFRRLVDEIQRSIGYYKSVNPGVRIGGILALGGSFKLPGLAKYLSENLHVPIRPLTEPQNFDLSTARNPRVFEESSLSFGVALGLVVQGCGMAPMSISLLPPELLQRKIIARKKPWAAGVAACALLMFGVAYYSTWLRSQELTDAKAQRVFDEVNKLDKNAEQFILDADKAKKAYDANINVSSVRQKLEEVRQLWTGRDFWLTALRKVYAPIPAEPENEKGVWLKRVVSERVEFDLVARVLADDKIKDLPAPLSFRSNEMRLEQGWLDRLKSLGRVSQVVVVGGGGTYVPPPGAGVPAPRSEEKISRPDVVLVVMQGETIHPEEGVYVNKTLVKELTNTWRCPNEKCGYTVKELVPPEKCPDPGKVDCKTTAQDFVLENPPLVVDVRYVSSIKEERFVDHMDRQVPVSSLDEESQRTWQAIVAREQDLLRGTITTWEQGNREGERLPRRAQFLAKLEQDRGIRLESFTEFQVVFFLDPSKDLWKEVDAQKKKAAAARASATTMSGGR